MDLCKYKDIFGKPNTGAHKYRFLGVAIIDVILTINNIDNPLNIKKGMVIKYPGLGEIDFFRIEVPTDLSKKRVDILGRLGKPNKQTKADPARQKYLKDEISLPPTVNSTPKTPVTIKNGQFNIGGI